VNNVLVERYTYDVFGQPTIRDVNGTEITSSTVGNPYAFTGRRYDPEAGLYYYRARYYDYATARFLQPDPSGYTDGLNLYAYVGNSPLMWGDPSGLCKEALMDAFRLWDRMHPGNPFAQARRTLDFLTMGPDYYRVFRGVDYGRGQAAGLAAIMAGGKVIGYSTLLEGLMGIQVRQQREIHGWERFGYGAVGGVQTLLSAVTLAQGLHHVTAPSSGISQACFAACTEVLTPLGYTPIEAIQAGDTIIAGIPRTDETVEVRVRRILRQDVAELIVLRLDGDNIETTAEHPFWIKDTGWVKAKDLWVGAELRSVQGEGVCVRGICREGRQTAVYNLSVSGPHTYFVSRESVLVHNKPASNGGRFVGRDALRRQNRGVFRDVANRVGLNNKQRELLHQAVTGQNFDYHEIMAIAKSLKGID